MAKVGAEVADRTCSAATATASSSHRVGAGAGMMGLCTGGWMCNVHCPEAGRTPYCQCCNCTTQSLKYCSTSIRCVRLVCVWCNCTRRVCACVCLCVPVCVCCVPTRVDGALRVQRVPFHATPQCHDDQVGHQKKTSRNVKLLKASMDLYRLALLFRGLAFVSVWWCCFSYGSVRSAVLPFCRV